MDIKPILAALGRHRITAVLITLEIALACAVLCNALFLFTGRLDLMQIDSGVDERALAVVALNGCEDCNNADLNARALSTLRAIPGVQGAGVVNAVPFSDPVANAGVFLDSEKKSFAGVPHFYTIGPGATEALGLRPTAGRAFAASDFQPFDGFFPKQGEVWISQPLANHLWPGENPLGKQFWSGESHFRVAGVVAHFPRPDPGRSEDGVAGSEWSVIVPVSDASQSGVYVLRADPIDLPRILQTARIAVARAVPESVLDQDHSRSVDKLRDRYFRSDRAMAWLLASVIAAMLLVTALGIVGLASFWVAQRTKQIGIRRALGATRVDILHYFQTENLLLTTAGIVLGMLLAYAANGVLMKFFELSRLPLFYLPIGAVLLWLLGQLAVLGPALRAAAIAPVVATRST